MTSNRDRKNVIEIAQFYIKILDEKWSNFSGIILVIKFIMWKAREKEMEKAFSHYRAFEIKVRDDGGEQV